MGPITFGGLLTWKEKYEREIERERGIIIFTLPSTPIILQVFILIFIRLKKLDSVLV